MIPSRVNLVYYSPTGTSKKIAESVVEGLGICERNVIDLTHPSPEDNVHSIKDDELLVIAVPVYSGRVPPIAVNRIKTLKGDDTPAVLLAVYGNRAFDDALLELKDITSENGFKAVAGGAFIGVHSFDTPETPIATGRPDDLDVKKAVEFGEKIKEKLEGLTEVPDLAVPGNHPYRKGGGGDPRSPETDPETCILCGTCAKVCPTAAVTVSDSVETVKENCTACTACVRNCPTSARHWEHEGIKKAAMWLHTNYSERREPETFL